MEEKINLLIEKKYREIQKIQESGVKFIKKDEYSHHYSYNNFCVYDRERVKKFNKKHGILSFFYSFFCKHFYRNKENYPTMTGEIFVFKCCKCGNEITSDEPYIIQDVEMFDTNGFLTEEFKKYSKDMDLINSDKILKTTRLFKEIEELKLILSEKNDTSKCITEYDSINNGFNSIVRKKSIKRK